MNYTRELEDNFPFNREVSLRKLLSFWESRSKRTNPAIADAARTILNTVAECPELTGEIVPIDVLTKHREIVELLLSALFPIARSETIMAAAVPPFYLKWFYATSRFAELDLISKFLDENEAHGCDFSVEAMFRQKVLSAYHVIGALLYDIDVSSNLPFQISSVDETTGLKRYYQINLDPSFVEIRTNGEPVLLSDEGKTALIADPGNLELWKELLPPEHFEFIGFVILNAVDVTEQATMSLIRDVLLRKEALVESKTIDRLEMHVQEMLGKPDLRLGLISLDQSREDYLPSARSVGRSLLIGDSVPECSTWSQSYYARALDTGEPVFVRDLENDGIETGYEWKLRAQHFRNAVIAPLSIGNDDVGLLELMSPNVGDVAPQDISRIGEVISLFAIGLKRQVEEQEDRVEAVIKRQYTAIHPVVEWRFRKAALKLLASRRLERQAAPEEIVFDKVYALYGLSDIRDSSVIRNHAIKEDLLEQLGLALRIIVTANKARPVPSLDELGYRISRFSDELAAGLRTGDEHMIILLLQSEVEPLFDSLSADSIEVAEQVAAYRASLNTDLKIVYRSRKEFEYAVSQVNDTVSAVLSRLEDTAQDMIPHYFEKFKTDGIDYNLYAGASLMEHGAFSTLDLKNLRIWQLSTMAEIVWEMNRVKSQLNIALDTAHLILVQTEPISIRFRVDEKKFDVDGAYNIRYEIIKKRIDKSRIEGSDERLTQPGMVAIVYSLDEEAREYTRYLDYLTAAGYFEPGIERHNLSKLQGVTGLRALRVTVAKSRDAPAQVENMFERNTKKDQDVVEAEGSDGTIESK